ncbi:unnamed protein product [Allacma fusca]|uniref:Uncharacterized protein n=1 Tax=Allacma fusca TaxID=39272 RepID=A0A8J2L782_9HEXA|nr:unnamed protein product [Allacma fusca]
MTSRLRWVGKTNCGREPGSGESGSFRTGHYAEIAHDNYIETEKPRIFYRRGRYKTSLNAPTRSNGKREIDGLANSTIRNVRVKHYDTPKQGKV